LSASALAAKGFCRNAAPATRRIGRCSFVHTWFTVVRVTWNWETSLEQELAPRRLGHDLINQLSIILGFSEFLLSALPESDSRRADVQEIEKAARTAMSLVSQNLLAPK